MAPRFVEFAAIGALLGAGVSLMGCGEAAGGGGGPQTPDSPASDLVETGLRSVSYAPMYLQQQDCIQKASINCSAAFPTDDFASPWAEPIWGDNGRGDLANVKALGANSIRLYGNDPRFGKKDFLDTARSHGLQVVMGLSSYWYKDPAGSQCAFTPDADCHDYIRDAYRKNLDGGFVEASGRYHTALTIFNIMNEPDFLGDRGQLNYLKAMVTAFDGILSAEKEKQVQRWANGQLPRLTITWSFATQADSQPVCSEKYFIHNTSTECGPGIIFMVQFYRAVMDPEGTLHYTPKNKLSEAYHSRWINSFNSFVGAAALDRLFIKPYMALDFLKDTHVFCGEFHPKPEMDAKDLQPDLKMLVKPGKPFIGVSYFQYQVAYNKEGTEREYGLFGLGSKIIGSTKYIEGDSATSHPVNCLVPSKGSMMTSHSTLAQAWGGSGQLQGLCPREDQQGPASRRSSSNSSPGGHQGNSSSNSSSSAGGRQRNSNHSLPEAVLVV